MPSAPVCWPSTQASQTTVASMGKAMARRKVAIHGPGRGSQRSRPGAQLSSTYGKAMPSPKAAKMPSACAAGKPHGKAQRGPHERGRAWRGNGHGQHAR